MDWQELCIFKAIVECQAKALGMQAENAQREHAGNAPAYTYDAFAAEIDYMNQVFEANRK